jgi:hypothetical protein
MSSSLTEFRTMDKVQKSSINECCTPSSEPYRVYSKPKCCTNSLPLPSVLHIQPHLLSWSHLANSRHFEFGYQFAVDAEVPHHKHIQLRDWPWNEGSMIKVAWSLIIHVGIRTLTESRIKIFNEKCSIEFPPTGAKSWKFQPKKDAFTCIVMGARAIIYDDIR